MVLESAGKEFGTEFGENFASGAGNQLAIGISESSIWLGSSIICASMWNGAYNVINNTHISNRRLRAAVALPSITTSILLSYAIYLKTRTPHPYKHSHQPLPPSSASSNNNTNNIHNNDNTTTTTTATTIHPTTPHSHDYNGNVISKPNKQKWWSRWLFGKKPTDGDVERGTSLKASGYNVHTQPQYDKQQQYQYIQQHIDYNSSIQQDRK